MSEDKYNVVFGGQVADGFTVENVKQNLSSRFQIPSDKVEKMFAQDSLVVKKEVDLPTALKIKEMFSEAGALCDIQRAYIPAAAPPIPDLPPVTKADRRETATQYGNEPALKTLGMLEIRQRVGAMEAISGIEKANYYEITDGGGMSVGEVKEEGAGMGNAIKRNLMRSKRPFSMNIAFFNPSEILTIDRKFSFFLSKLKLTRGNVPIGEVNQKFSFFSQVYSIIPAGGGPTLTIKSKRRYSHMTKRSYQSWTFNIYGRANNEVALIKKEWSGLMREMADSDTFRVQFYSNTLELRYRQLILAAAFAIDMDSFENDSGSGGILSSIIKFLLSLLKSK